MEEQTLIKLLFRREEEALEALAKQYESVCTAVLRRILDNESDIEECKNEVWLAVWNAIPPASPQSLGAFVASIARKIGIDRFRYEHREKRNCDSTIALSELASDFSDISIAGESTGSVPLSVHLNAFLRTLDKETRVLFLRRYFYFESVELLADRFGMRKNTIAARLYRTRKKLKHYLEQEGYFL